MPFTIEGGAAPTPGPAGAGPTPAPAGGGSAFSFGATAPPPSSSTSGPSSSTAPSPGVFSFGNAITGGGATAPAAVGGSAGTSSTSGGRFSFGSAPGPTAPSAAPGAPAPAPSTGSTASGETANPSSQQPRHQPTASVPPFDVIFPRIAIHSRLGSILSRLSSEQKRTGDSSMTQSLTGQELIHLLRCDSPVTSAPTNRPKRRGRNEPFGHLLANPNPLLTFAASPDTQLRNRLQSNPYVTLLSGNDEDDSDRSSSSNKQLAGMTPQILQEMFTLADELHISEIEAMSLYAAASDVETRRWLEETLVCSFVDGAVAAAQEADDEERWFSQRQRSSTIFAGAGAGVPIRTQEFSHQQQQQQQNNKKKRKKIATDPLAPLSLGNDVPRAARELYFYERGQLLSALFVLIKHRVQVASAEWNHHHRNNHGTAVTIEKEKLGEIDSPILEATDQLLQSNLIGNLVALIRTVSQWNAELNKKIKAGRKEEQEEARAAAQAQATGGSASASTLFGGVTTTQSYPIGAFGTTTPNNSSSTTPLTSTTSQETKVVNDMDHVMSSFLYQQRKMATECLFYLTYHTQCTAEEVCDIIDLIKDLTNGDVSGSNIVNDDDAWNGLPLLDIVRHTPNPYIAITNFGNDGTGMMGFLSGSNSSGINAGAGFGFGLNPQQQQQQYFTQQQQQQTQFKEKDRLEWEKELVRSLWREGKLQLLRSVSTLVLCVVCALDSGHVSMDRDLHGPNEFGMGNALLPPPTSNGVSSTTQLHPIHSRLDPGSEPNKGWKRQDIWGLLAASYALLLQPSVSVLVSPQRSPRSPSNSPLSSSQRHRGDDGSSRIDIKSSFLSSLEVATVMKSLTFARLSLLPSFHPHSVSAGNDMDVDTSDFAFYMSVLSEFTARYLDALCAFGELPISRAQWQSDEEKELQLRHVHEEQRRQFGIWSGQPAVQAEIPTEVDITKRPDCIDDVIALAVSVCSACPEYSVHFWLTTEEVVEVGDGADETMQTETHLRLAPSRALRKLERRMQEYDPSLLPAYLSFLSALALADSPEGIVASNGAAVVHSILSDAANSGLSSTSSDAAKKLTWSKILDTIRWYADRLSPSTDDTGAGPTLSRRGSTENLRRSPYESIPEASTAYYYGSDRAGMHGEGGYYQPAQSQETGPSSSLSRDRRQRRKEELSETDNLTLLSLLVLISHVTSKSIAAQTEILSMKLPVPGSGMFSGIEDDALTILFSLLTAPISPERRGLTFVAIANLIRCKLPMEKTGNVNIGKKAWELLEACQILPIGLLGQYAPQTGNVMDRFMPGAPGFRSQSNVTSGGGYTSLTSWLPPSENLGIIYEMEYVESRMGMYPGTEGFLYLLSTLVLVAGCPANLGSQWRPRAGCAPYVEFVIDFVIPRAMGTRKEDRGLPFATFADKSRLLCRALEVVEAVVTRCVVPPPLANIKLPKSAGTSATSVDPLSLQIISRSRTSSQSPNSLVEQMMEHHRATIQKATQDCGLSLVRDRIFLPTDFAGVEDAIRDYSDGSAKVNDPGQIASDSSAIGGLFGGNGQRTIIRPSSDVVPSQSDPGRFIPRAKSPGFIILSNILASNGGTLFHTIAKVLMEKHDARGIGVCYGQAVHDKVLAEALFGDIPPSYGNVKEAVALTGPVASSIIRSMLQPLYPPTLHPTYERDVIDYTPHYVSSLDGVSWRERSLSLALNVLCSCAAREEPFARAVHATSTPLSIVPVLKFQGPVRGSFDNRGLEVRDVQVTRLSRLFVASAGATVFRDYPNELLPVIAQYVGYSACSLSHEHDMAVGAMSLVMYVNKTMTRVDSLNALCGQNKDGGARLSESLSRRLALSSEGNGSSERKSLRCAILDLILSNIYPDTDGGTNLAQVLLGLSSIIYDVNGPKWLNRESRRQGSGEHSRYRNCLDAMLGLLWDIDFILNGRSSVLATKCFEIVYRLCNARANSSTAVARKIGVMSKLRGMDFWYFHLPRFLGDSFHGTGTTSASVLHAVVSSLDLSTSEEGAEVDQSDHNVLHSIAWFLKGVANELYSLMGIDTEGYVDDDASLSGVQALAAPKPTQCRRLLSLLFASPHTLMLNSLLDFPRSYSMNSTAEFLGRGPRFRELVKASKVIIPGPREVYGSYFMVDINQLLLSMRQITEKGKSSPFEAGPVQPSSDDEWSAVMWARSWNRFAANECASSHLASAWGNVLGASVVCCHPILFSDQYEDSMVGFRMNSRSARALLERGGVIELLTAVLSRLSRSQRQDYGSWVSGRQLSASRQRTASEPMAYNITEKGGTLSLSIATLRLVELLIEMSHKVSPHSSKESALSVSGEEDLMKVCVMLADAVVACATVGGSGAAPNDESVAILSYALTVMLTLDGLQSVSNTTGDTSFSFMAITSWNERESFLNAAIQLSDLASIGTSGSSVSDYMRSGRNEHDDKATAVALAARSGLSSLLSHFDRCESTQNESFAPSDSFVVQVFAPRAGEQVKTSSRLARLIRLITILDKDAAFLLQRIACCRHGTELLLNAGVSTALLSAAREYSQEEAGMAADLGHVTESSGLLDREAYSTFQVESPSFLLGHLSLLNTLISSPSLLPTSLNQLVADATEIVKSYASVGERLLRFYPRDGDLTTKFVTSLFLISSSLAQSPRDITKRMEVRRDTNSSIMAGVIGDGNWIRLERRVIDLACHIAEYPFPNQLLPPLPNRLLELERARLSRMSRVSVTVRGGKCWWDLIQIGSNERRLSASSEQDLLLPDPPTGPADSGGWQRRRYGLSDSKNAMNWSEEKYALAISAANCLDVCLLFLKSQLNLYPWYRVTTALDGIALAKGLCRCSDAARAIEDRLGIMQDSAETELAAAMENTAMMGGKEKPYPTATQMKQVERNALLVLGPMLGRCSEHLLVLALLQWRSLTGQPVESSGVTSTDQTKKGIDEFAAALLPALEHTQIESTGSGCVDLGKPKDDERKSFSMRIAQSLREELEYLVKSGKSHAAR